MPLTYGSYPYAPQPHPYYNPFQPLPPPTPGINYNQNAQAFTQAYDYRFDPTGGQGFGNTTGYPLGPVINPTNYKGYLPEPVLEPPHRKVHDHSKSPRRIPTSSVRHTKGQPAINAPGHSSQPAGRSPSDADLADEDRPGAVYVPCIPGSEPGIYYCIQDPELKPGQYPIYYQKAPK